MPLSEALLIDNMEYMRSLPDNRFSLVIADPPYGIGEDGGKCRTRGSKKTNGEKRGWDNKIPEVEYFTELQRISKNQIIWGGNYFAHLLPSSRCWIYWQKNMGGDFADGELAWTSFDRVLKQYTKRSETFNRIHPTQKPVDLYSWILKNYAESGDSIFDPNFGSGSSRIAAYDMGFDYTGCEADEVYFKDAEKRFKIHKKQTKLFTPEPLETIQTELFSS